MQAIAEEVLLPYVTLTLQAALLTADVVVLSTVRSLPSGKPLGSASAKWLADQVFLSFLSFISVGSPTYFKWMQLGLLADSRFINVALTRARRAICIIGNAVGLGFRV